LVVIDAEVVYTDSEPVFDRLHSRCFDHQAVACVFDLLRLDGGDLRRLPLSERKAKLGELPRRSKDGIHSVEPARKPTVASCTKPPASWGWRESSRNG
jgi:ATP-dependent DNA ligase